MKKILSLLLVALMIVGMLPMNAIHAHAAETATSSMAVVGTTGVKAGDSSSISWTNNVITFTNYKAGSSTAIRSSDSTHYRVYAKSEVEVVAPGNITSIVITSSGSSYVTPWVESAKEIGTATSSGNDITIVPTTPAASIKFTASAQVRLTNIEVTYEVAGGDDTCAHTNTTEVAATAATCEAPGYTAGVQCSDCEAWVSGHEVIAATGHAYGEWVDVTAATCTEAGEQKATCANCGNEKTQTVAALGHNYVDGTCTGCGNVAVMTVYELVTNAASLKADDQLIFVGADADGAYSVMIPYVSGNNLKAESISAPVDGKISLADTSAAAIITLGGDSNAWTLFDGTYYLYAAGGTSSNHLKGKTELPTDNTGAWTIVIDEAGEATITSVGNTGDGARNTVKFNYGNSPVLFSCYKVDYATNVNLVSIYRLSDGTTEEPGCAHENTTTETVAATCTEAGSETVTCADCGEVVSTTVLEATGHSFVDNVCTGCGKEFESEVDTPDQPASSSATIDFSTTDQRVSQDTESQVWANGGATVTNNKSASTSNIIDSSNPVRFYKNSDVVIAFTGMTKIEVACNTEAYATALASSISDSNAAVSVDGTAVTIVFANAVDSFTITLSGGQVRVNSLTVKAEVSDCTHEWGAWVVTTAPTCTETGVETMTCSLCGDTMTQTVAATGHTYTYVDGSMTCTCGDVAAFSTIAEAKAFTDKNLVYYIKGIVTYVSGKNVYIEDATGGICVYFATADDASGIALGDEIVVWDTMTTYNGLIETTNTTAQEYLKVSSGNALPSQVVTLAALLADTTNEYLGERVVVENVTIGVLGTNNTALTDADGNTINIYKAPALNAEINENDTVTVTAIVSTYNGYQLFVNSADDVVETASGEEEVITTVTIAEAKAGTVGEYYQVEGVVTYISGRNVYVQDATGAIVVYLTANAATTQVGDKVKAYGALKNYNGLLELDAVDETNVKFYEVLSSDNAVEAKELTIAELLAATDNTYLAELVTLNNVRVSYYSYNASYGNVTYTLLDDAGNTIKINRVTVANEEACVPAGALVNLEANVSAYVTDSTEGNGYQLVTDNAKIAVLSVCAHETTELVNASAATCTEAGYTGDTMCTVCGYYTARGEEIAALDHDYQETVTPPTCTEQGYTTYICSRCGAVEGEPDDFVDPSHNYVNGVCSVCGAKNEDADLKFQTIGVSFQDYVGIQCIVNKNLAAIQDKGYEKFYVVATQNVWNSDGTFTEKAADMLVVDYGTRMKFDIQIVSWAMTETVNVTLYAEKDGVVYVGEQFTTSVEELALDKIAGYEASGDSARCTAFVDMLNFGAAVQTSYNHNAENPANRYLEERGFTKWATTEEPAFEKVNSNTEAGAVAVQSAAISLQEKAELQFIFRVPVSQYELRYTVNGVTSKMTSDKFEAMSSVITKISIGVKAANFRDEFTVALYDPTTDEPVTAIYTVSVEAYAKNNLTGAKRDAYIALMKYGDAVSNI